MKKSKQPKPKKGQVCNDPNQITTHHRKPKRHKGIDDYRNISHIPRYSHQAWHTLFATMHPEEIAEHINKLYLDPNYFFVCKKKPRK